MRRIIASGTDKDGDLQVEVAFDVPSGFSWDMCRHLGLQKCVPEAAAFANIHRGTGPLEQWTFWVREKHPFPWAQYLSPF